MKIDHIGRTCFALNAGNALIPIEIIEKVKEKYSYRAEYKISEIETDLKDVIKEVEPERLDRSLETMNRLKREFVNRKKF